MSRPSSSINVDVRPTTLIRASSDDFELRLSRSSSALIELPEPNGHGANNGASLIGGLARHTLGLVLLLFVVFLWTTSNFLGSVGLIYQRPHTTVVDADLGRLFSPTELMPNPSF